MRRRTQDEDSPDIRPPSPADSDESEDTDGRSRIRILPEDKQTLRFSQTVIEGIRCLGMANETEHKTRQAQKSVEEEVKYILNMEVPNHNKIQLICDLLQEIYRSIDNLRNEYKQLSKDIYSMSKLNPLSETKHTNDPKKDSRFEEPQRPRPRPRSLKIGSEEIEPPRNRDLEFEEYKFHTLGISNLPGIARGAKVDEEMFCDIRNVCKFFRSLIRMCYSLSDQGDHFTNNIHNLWDWIKQMIKGRYARYREDAFTRVKVLLEKEYSIPRHTLDDEYVDLLHEAIRKHRRVYHS